VMESTLLDHQDRHGMNQCGCVQRRYSQMVLLEHLLENSRGREGEIVDHPWEQDSVRE
jgi:hypothetical protein